MKNIIKKATIILFLLFITSELVFFNNIAYADSEAKLANDNSIDLVQAISDMTKALIEAFLSETFHVIILTILCSLIFACVVIEILTIYEMKRLSKSIDELKIKEDNSVEIIDKIDEYNEIIEKNKNRGIIVIGIIFVSTTLLMSVIM